MSKKRKNDVTENIETTSEEVVNTISEEPVVEEVKEEVVETPEIEEPVVEEVKEEVKEEVVETPEIEEPVVEEVKEEVVNTISEEPVVEDNAGEVDESEKFLVKINIHPSKIVKAMERLDKKGFKYLQTNSGNLYLEQRFETKEDANKCRTAMHKIGLLAEVVFK